MHRDIILVPAYFRPEFLDLCLEYIWNCPESLNKDVWIYHDQKFDDFKKFEQDLKDVEEVVAYWKRGFGNRFRCIMRPENGFYGNSYNVLGAYVKAYETDAQYVYLVEEDVFITPDFFRWHEAVQKSGDYFCTIAGKCDRNPEKSGIEGYFESSEYASLGVCWKRENLSWVPEHAIFDYYHNPTPHILKKFPGSRLGLQMMEQDGLIQRVMEQSFQKAAWACVPRAYHLGLWGYHRSIGVANMFQGNFAARKEKLRKSISDSDWLNKVADFQTDIQPYPFAPLPQWDKITLV